MSLLFKGRRQSAVEKGKISRSQLLVMFFVNHARQAVASLGELWRSPVATMMTIGVLGLSITLPSTLYIMVKNTERISADWEQASEISLFIKKDASQADVRQLISRIELWPEIAQVQYIPANQALDEFKQLSGFGEALDYLDDNPLPDVLLVTPTSKHSAPTTAGLLLDKLRDEREVELGKLDIEWLERLHAMLAIAKNLVLVIAMLLFLAVVLIIGNTIRLNVLNKRNEILVMKLVGATDAFIQRPFLYTGFWYGFLGGVLAWFIVVFLLWWMSNSISNVVELYKQSFSLTGLHFSELLFMLVLSVSLGLAGSLLSVRRHVQEIEPQ